jgi:hypothetical protein
LSIAEFAQESLELGVNADTLAELREWKYKDQPHYSLETRRILVKFQLAYVKYRKVAKCENYQTYERGERCQQLWEQLLKARREETGKTVYLNPVEYAEAVKSKST